jgi:ArsR family transcriptional regulator, arsenate/arsenite/antimonite-responsive transcriptional repressor / arsenate reductase (thioredoxin)
MWKTTYADFQMSLAVNHHPVEFFKQLGEPTRLALVLLTMRHGELCVCDLMTALDEPQSKISRHLSSLRNSGLLLAERRGQWVYYRVGVSEDSAEFDLLSRALEHYSDLIAPCESRLANGCSDVCSGTSPC